MNTRLLDLSQLGSRFKAEDYMILDLVLNRMNLSLRVGQRKIQTGGKIVVPDREDERLAAARVWAAARGLNSHFAETLLYGIIDESCKLQLVQLENFQELKREGREQQLMVDTGEPTDAEWGDQLKRNLLTLTERWCDSYDEVYEKHGCATKAYLDFERTIIESQISQLTKRGTFVDIGCATGRLTFHVSQHFYWAIGYDISPHMVSVARAKVGGLASKNVSFEEVDIETGIPLGNETASFVVMNFGTASDVVNVEKVIEETMRILEPGGRFVFSFYNRDALVYNWEFLPWTVGLVATIDLQRNCLEVVSRDKEHPYGEVLPIHAHPRTVDEIMELFRTVGVDVGLKTYPTLSSLLPEEMLKDYPPNVDRSKARQAVMELDEILSTASKGAYIIATGQK